MTHDELAVSLAGHLKGPDVMVWTDIQLGPVGSPRPDVYSVRKSYVNPDPRAFEVKVSRQDFFADVGAGKWQKYLSYAGSVSFGVPAGLVQADEVPATCGLLIYGESGWRTRRRATPDPVNVPQEAWLKLLIDGIAREGVRPQSRVRLRLSGGGFERKWGREAAEVVDDLLAAKERLRNIGSETEAIVARARANAKHIADEASRAWEDLGGALGLGSGAARDDIRAAIRRLVRPDEGEDRKFIVRLGREIGIHLQQVTGNRREGDDT